jgi:hypothetical protein
MKINVKEGVVFKEFNGFYFDVFTKATSVWTALIRKTPTVTSANDGKHMDTSYHYKNLALDLRINDVPESAWPKLKDELQDQLGSEYQVILEKDHIHVEPS